MVPYVPEKAQPLVSWVLGIPSYLMYKISLKIKLGMGMSIRMKGGR
jgi:hypothetical protein